MRLKLPGAHK